MGSLFYHFIPARSSELRYEGVVMVGLNDLGGLERERRGVELDFNTLLQ